MNTVMWAMFSFSHATLRQELGILGGALVMLMGMRLCWTAPRYRMSMEERVKDGEITEAKARRNIQMAEVSGPVAVVLGAGLLAWALLA